MGKNKRNKAQRKAAKTDAHLQRTNATTAPSGEGLPKTHLSSYRAAQAIMYYMDTCKRMAVAEAHPKTFGKIDRLVPHRIALLKFSKNFITINHMEYRFQSFSVYRTGQMQTVDGEADEFGNELDLKIPQNQKLADGDILIKRPDGYQRAYQRPVSRMEPMERLIQRVIWDKTTPNSSGMRIPPIIDLTSALRHVLTTLLGKYGPNGRIHTVGVLSVAIDEGILRLPTDFKLIVQSMKLAQNASEVFKAIQPILHPSKLARLQVDVENPRDPILSNHAITSRADSLHIYLPVSAFEFGNNVAGGVFNSYPHKNVVLFDSEISSDHWINIARTWIRQPRQIGDKFGMVSKNIQNLLRAARLQLNAKEGVLASRKCSQFPKCVTVQLANSELNMYGAKSPFHEQEKSCKTQALWQIVIEVMEQGSAAALN